MMLMIENAGLISRLERVVKLGKTSHSLPVGRHICT